MCEATVGAFLRKDPNHFWEPDLYTTRFMGHANDDIERLLFGAIDKSGQKASMPGLTRITTQFMRRTGRLRVHGRPSLADSKGPPLHKPIE